MSTIITRYLQPTTSIAVPQLLLMNTITTRVNCHLQKGVCLGCNLLSLWEMLIALSVNIWKVYGKGYTQTWEGVIYVELLVFFLLCALICLVFFLLSEASGLITYFSILVTIEYVFHSSGLDLRPHRPLQPRRQRSSSPRRGTSPTMVPSTLRQANDRKRRY